MQSMMSKFSKNISTYVEAELTAAMSARKQGSTDAEFKHLENAHVLGQESTYWHTKVHGLMLMWGFRNLSLKEILGQLFRIIGAATMTAIGFVPQGNTGGANVSPFRPMPLEPEHQEIIEQAKVS
jgi:hypothetical protein